jgi:hypothetical protein
MKRETFPTIIPQLAAYFLRAVSWLTANATRLGISTGKLAEITDLYGDETTPYTYVYAKLQYDKAPQRKDSVITANLKNISDKLKVLLRNTYNDIPASVWTDDDRLKLNRRTGLDHHPTHPVTPISEECFIDIEAHPQCLMKGGARSVSEGKTYALPEDVKQVEVRYAIIQGKFPIPDDMKDKVKVDCIGPNDGTTSVIFTKAVFKIQLSEIFAAYNFCCWARWINIQHPDLAGEWSEKHTVMIL